MIAIYKLTGHPLHAEFSRAAWELFGKGTPICLMTTPSKQPFPRPLREVPSARAIPGWDSGLPADCAAPRAPAQNDPRHSGWRRGQPRERKAEGEKGQTLKLPGCGLCARMLSVLSTSWQQQHGPGRRRRCGNGVARVAEPAFAAARSPPEALPALPSAARPPRGRERVRGAGRPARGAPCRGAARELEAARPARAAARRRGGAAWPGRLSAGAEERSGPPGEGRARRPRGRTAAGERTPLAVARAQVTRHVPSPSPDRARAPRPRLPRPGAGSRRWRRRVARGRPAGRPGEPARPPDGPTAPARVGPSRGASCPSVSGVGPPAPNSLRSLSRNRVELGLGLLQRPPLLFVVLSSFSVPPGRASRVGVYCLRSK